ncbi:DNA helicase [Paraconexibacter sp. AEG42_29]|uniref:DNA helicase n=1 Tax=Paraconexibacter sp. AEG42_29 TaxID=2997339 RepID=A0AAU7B018_9ACTN
MEAVPPLDNVALRDGPGGTWVVLAFPYDAQIVNAARSIPGRRFDWDTKEWLAPVGDWVAVHVAEIVERFPELQCSPEVVAWLSETERRWIGIVSAAPAGDGGGAYTLTTRAGKLPEEVASVAVPHPDGRLRAPLTVEVTESLQAMHGARFEAPAVRCAQRVLTGLDVPPGALKMAGGVDGPALKLDVLWDTDAGAAFERLPGVLESTRTLPLDPWVLEGLEPFLALHRIEVDGMASDALRELRLERDEAQAAIARSKARTADPIDGVAERLGGELRPFQWAGVRYLLEARRAFLADEQGLGKTVQALATLEADDAYPALVVAPASLKLVWEREAGHWLPHRTVAIVNGRGAVPPEADIVILNYEIVAAHREALSRRRPRALIVDESHHCKNPRAKRTQAVRRLAEAVPADGLRLALTGTPVLNHAEELISQLRVIGRLSDFGSGASFSRQFEGNLSEERLHWHLRRRCFVRRRKDEVLPQLPAKRRVVVPVALTNKREYRVAEDSVIEWLRSQPLELDELNAKISATLRAERLAQIGTLKRLAARGKLAAAVVWIADFLEHGEPLVVFARHVEVLDAVRRHFPDALHLVGRDSAKARDAAVTAFQNGTGPQLLICSTPVAGQGLTLTRASNVCFLELEWTPAMHDQAEDRCHRIGQHDAVTAWYLLAAESIDETIAQLLEAKRSTVGAVTDGDRALSGGLVDDLVADLRERPLRHLRAAG